VRRQALGWSGAERRQHTDWIFPKNPLQRSLRSRPFAHGCRSHPFPHSEKGGFCDCYSTYGYGGDTYPDCNRLSSSSVPTLIGLGVIPFILCFFLLVIVINMGRQLKAADSTTRNAKKKKRKNKVIKRGGFALLLSSIFFLVLIASTILSVIDPLLTSRNAFFDYGFRISLSAYSFFAVPALYIVPICWIETILSSRKLKIKTSYVKGKVRKFPPIFLRSSPSLHSSRIVLQHNN